ncbi:hypothetical protein AB0R12_26590 [Streptomyces niveus]|uniref:hypothetical protein n=2 Tax=Streptomyces niveus TaxID=193462 RepID=UPI00342E55BA
MSELERDDLLPQLWGEHMRAEFPAYLRGRDVEGEDLVLLDADVAGCVSSSLSSVLDERRRETLLKCIAALEKVLPSIGDAEGTRYYERLHEMALLAAGLGNVGDRYLQPFVRALTPERSNLC